MMPCITQLLHALEHWTKSLDDGNDVDLDFCKAFNCVPHQRVLCKLKASGKVLNWIMDILSNGQQRVNVNGLCSDRSSVISGALQRSVLGPLLFIVYCIAMSDLCLKLSKVILLFLLMTPSYIYLSIPLTIVVPYNLILICWWSGV